MKISVKSRAVALGGGLLMLAGAWGAGGATSPTTRESSYTIYSRGIRVGELKTVCSLVPHNEKKAVKFESTTKVSANFLVYSYNLETEEEALVSEEGTVRYRRTTREKGGQCRVEGRLDRGKFMLDVTENGARRTLAVNRDRYDYTTMECPEITMKHEGDEMTLRLLDLETLAVVTRKYRWVKSEDVEVDGRKIRCRVIDFADQNKKCRRWIAPAEPGAIVARQDGSGNSGAYSLRIAHLRGGG